MPRKADPLNIAPSSCNCTLSAASASKEITLQKDTGVYFVPAEADLFQRQFTPQPFLISNPVKFNPKTNRIKKESVDKEDYSHELSERVDTYESSKTFIQASNDDGSQPPSYLDLEIQDVSNSETAVVQQGNSIPSLESAEKVLVECLDLHILEFTRKYGLVENFSEFWEARNLKIYKDLSDSDLNEKIKEYCSETENLMKQSLEDIKRGVPKKKVNNLKYIPDDKDGNRKKHETKESVRSFEFRSFSSMTEPTSIDDSRIDQPSLLSNSIKHNLLAQHNLVNFVSKYETSLEDSTSPYLSHTSLNADKINESKSVEINSHISENTLSDITIVTTKNTAKDYDTEFDMDTMASDVIFKTINDINQFDSKLATKPISDEKTIFSISSTPLSDVLSFRDASSVTEKSWSEKQRHSPVFNLNTIPSEDTLKISNQTNKSSNEFIRKEPVIDETTIFSASKTPIDEEPFFRDISQSTPRSAAEKEERTTETKEFGLDIKPPVILKSNNTTNQSRTNIASNELILDHFSLFPASTLKYDKLSLEDLNKNSSMDEKKKQGQDEEGEKLDLDTKPLEVILKPNNKTDKISSELILDNTTHYSTSTTTKSAEISPGDTSSNSDKSKIEKEGENEDEGTRLDSITTSSDITFKPSDEPFTGIEPISDDNTFFPTESTSSQKYKTSLDSESGNTERLMSKLPEKHNDGDVDLDLKTTSYNVMNITDSRSTLDDTFNFPTTSKALLNKKPRINIHEGIISKTGPEEDTSVSFISTTPGIAVQSQHRNKFSENEVQIPSIITKECQNNVVQSFISGKEALPNNDFEHKNAKSQSLQEKNKQVNSDDYSDLNTNSSVEGTVASVMFNNSYISGNLYFGSSQELVPVRLLQTDTGKISLGIDGHSLCEKLYTSKEKSLLLSTLCDCVNKMAKNNSTEYLNK
ncbi:hypothetical protein MSG28_000992 [Choristoneura fumiferana]|uniref:Uncharacterized protein n=1 Tax=Choristoneura fumiferana TaxID=7141 RepID=A0ACC0K377_CHOFU|nr:hypothetical protein MSG28_000992 [Choristoneura fumiferana]